MTSPQEMVAEFQAVFGQEPDPELQLTLVREEFLELVAELRAEDRDPYCVAKEVIDLLYVTYGLAHMLRIDAEWVFRDVHLSNMSKVDDYGNAIFNEAGKVLKGPNYRPPVFRKEWFK